MEALLALLALIFNLETGDRVEDPFGEMDDEALAELQANLEAAAVAASDEDLTRADVENLTRAAEAVEMIRVEASTREEEADALAAERDAALARIRGEADDGTGEEGDGDGDDNADGDAEGEGDDAGDGDGTEGDGDGEGTEGGAEAEADEAQPIAAAGGTPPPAAPVRTRPRATRVAPSHQPRDARNANVFDGNLVASGDVRGISAGAPFQSVEQLAEALHEKADAVRSGRRGDDGEQYHVARLNYERQYPPERRLTRSMSAEETGARIEGANAEALVAAGGLCAPPDVRYTLTTFGQSNRPFRDSLPGFQAPHGAISIIPSPLLGDIVIDAAGGAIDSFTAAEDVSGSAYPKTVQEITCAEEVTTEVTARTLQFKNGNFAERFYPERLRAFVALGDVAFARDGDAKLLALVKAGSTDYTNAVAEFGAYRDLRRQVIAVAQELRDRIRDYNVRLRLVLPEYVPAMLVTDLVAQQPGDSALEWNVDRMRADIASWVPGLTVTYVLDSVRANGRLLTTPTQPAPDPGTPSPRSATFDADVEWAMYPEGTWGHLDGGTLDLGVVRDSTLNAANRFQTFMEQWETVFRLLDITFSAWVTSSLCASGYSQAATDVDACGPSGS